MKLAAILCLLLGCAALALAGVVKASPWLIAVGPGFLVVASALALIRRRARPEVRISAALLMVLCLVVIYGIEFLLSRPVVLKMDARKEAAAKQAQRTFDVRSPTQVIKALRDSGQTAYPAVFPRKLLAPAEGKTELRSPYALNGREVLPLSGLPEAVTVHCNESGEYSVYNSDEFGFRNDKGLWRLPKIDAALLGDSFLQGDCVGQGEDVASRLRAHRPSTITLGMRNNGPLIELAGLREYLLRRRPNVVVWFFYEGNDFEDLAGEMQSPLLRAYLEESDFSQALEEIGGEVAQTVKGDLDRQLDQQFKLVANNNDYPLQGLVDWMLLRSTRSLLGLSLSGSSHLSGKDMLAARAPGLLALLDPRAQPAPVQAPDRIEDYRRILAKGRDMVASWGGRLLLVYLPDPIRLCGRIDDWRKDCPTRPDLSVLERRRSDVTDIAQALGVEMRDLTPILEQDQHPERYYLYYGSHHSREGYAWLAAQVETVLGTMP